jgi:hypothetical protein
MSREKKENKKKMCMERKENEKKKKERGKARKI